MTDVLGLASIVTLYQAGNAIYDLFDKVLILDNGNEIYYGPTREARPFMEGLGFMCQDGFNVADFLTGVTVPMERRILPGHELSFPRTAGMVKIEYEKSEIWSRMQTEQHYVSSEQATENTRLFRQSVAVEKHARLSESSVFTVDFAAQVLACTLRQYQIVWGAKITIIVKQLFTIVLALVVGSLFYNTPDNSGGLFMKGGAIFFSLMYNSLLSMTELTESFVGRPILIKHKSFALYHPAAFCIAQIATDIPSALLQVSTFSLILYFMVGLETSATAFFTFWAILIATTMVSDIYPLNLEHTNLTILKCMTAMFRGIGASFSSFDAAAKAAGLLISGTIMYTGYMIQKPQMRPWLVWIYWINPLAYAFNALLSTEFHSKVINCVGSNLIPNGPGYNDFAHQSCAGITAAVQGETSFTGDQYLAGLSYGYSSIWRNFGIIWAWWALFVAITIFATSRWVSASESRSTLMIPRERSKGFQNEKKDEEAQLGTEKETNGSFFGKSGTDAENLEVDTAGDKLARNTSVFTWKSLSYTVKTPSGDRVLLNNTQGWIKPGTLGALMGCSGAGKTTLLDVLAQRKTEGTISGSILVDGRPLPVSFRRSAGYCEQLDVHEPFATVREALEFSALLRQPGDKPREEKMLYVDTIIDLLELQDLQDTLIGNVGAGLTVEQRKRVTIGVELVSKPSILMFLDEPTSGLDGQSAYNTIRFLRKLADLGQAVLVTIHQPSAQVFSQFDTLLLLDRGGKTAYFGDIGHNAQTIKSYFSQHNVPCPIQANIAEHIIDVVSGHLSQRQDWHQIWLSSPEHEATTKELDRINAEAVAKPSNIADDKTEFALPLWQQIKLVTHRMNISQYRNTEYINNKVILHVFSALFNGFSFWMIGDSVNDLQMRLFTVFHFIFVAPGAINQLQPLFLQRRAVFETREKKSSMYSWFAFTTALVVSEMPYLCICAFLYFVCWYFTVGFPRTPDRAGATLFVMLIYEFVYTGIGQFVAACAPNEVVAALCNPLIIGVLISFCGVLVPYTQIQVFWRYWIYWLNPFNYLIGSLLTFTIWDTEVVCNPEELAVFDLVGEISCGQYLTDYLNGVGSGSRLLNPDATGRCQVCPFSSGSTYLQTMSINDYSYGWRDAGIIVIFAISSYSLVYALMRLRIRAAKKT
jgi:ABC-type multidrug transport system permease subunit/ABC-type multidrug transport system ATPase subunit